MRFNVVYHIAVLNHWQRVVGEQLRILLRNKHIGNVYVTVGADSSASTASCSQFVESAFGASGRSIPLQVLPRGLGEFEHCAMLLIDEVVRQDDAPVLYFHAKGVSHLPPVPLYEAWRGYLNQFVGEADGWAELLLSQPGYDACGPLKLHENVNGFTYFAGNFWMAKAAYMRQLPPYAEFMRQPVPSTYLPPYHRALAEVAVNRTQSMKGLAADNTDLTHESVWPYLRQVLAEQTGKSA